MKVHYLVDGKSETVFFEVRSRKSHYKCWSSAPQSPTERDYELAEGLWPGLSRARLREKMEENAALMERMKGETDG